MKWFNCMKLVGVYLHESLVGSHKAVIGHFRDEHVCSFTTGQHDASLNLFVYSC